ncbi:MAG: guanylate kinase [Nitrospirota bacterium]
MNKKHGLLFVISAPSGAGKTTLCRAVTESLENITHSISYTTREPRVGEIDGRDYYFVTEERFQEMITAGDFAEFAQVHSHWYGTSRRVLQDLISKNIDVILDIDTQGAQQIKQKYASAVYVFIMPPSLGVLEERLRNRKSNREDDIQRRMSHAREEIKDYLLYDYVVINRDFDRALTELRSIITTERCRTNILDNAWIDTMFNHDKPSGGNHATTR